MSWEIREGDCLELLRAMPERSVHCTVTSPPYWGLRDYGEAGQLGLEATPELYVEHLVAVFEEVRRVLRDDGTLWLNLGDCYATGAGKVGDHPGGGAQGEKWKGARTQPNRLPIPGLKPKDLVGIPWRVAFALQQAGWWLRSDVIWAKPNPMPESVTDRPTRAHEYVFLLTKAARYFYDAEAIREGDAGRASGNGFERPERLSGGLSEGSEQEWLPGGGRNKRSVWEIATRPFPGAHFATFPPDLVEPCILAGTPPKTCGLCGAPWRRVLDRVHYGDLGSRTLGHDELEVGNSRNRLPNGQTPYTPPRTVGWEPTCDHSGRFEPVEEGHLQRVAPPERDAVDDTGRAVVLDPFSGAATTGLVATQQGRNFIGLELNPEYAQMGRERIERWEANPAGALSGDPEPMPGQIGLLDG